MMHGQWHMAVAVRAPNGSIAVHEEPLNAAIYRHPLMKMPVLRGLVALCDALGLGMKALMFSGEVAATETTDDRPRTIDDGAPTRDHSNNPSSPIANGPSPSEAFTKAAWVSIVFALSLMVGILFVLPVLAAGFITG